MRWGAGGGAEPPTGVVKNHPPLRNMNSSCVNITGTRNGGAAASHINRGSGSTSKKGRISNGSIDDSNGNAGGNTIGTEHDHTIRRRSVFAFCFRRMQAHVPQSRCTDVL